MKTPSIKTILQGKNGLYSSKRVAGFLLFAISFFFAYRGNNDYANTCVVSGAGLISAGVLERKNSADSTDEMG